MEHLVPPVMIFGHDKKFLTARFLPYPQRHGITRQSLPMPQDHWLPGFNFNIEEWDAKWLTYETLATAAHSKLWSGVVPRPERGAGAASTRSIRIYGTCFRSPSRQPKGQFTTIEGRCT
jgi:hypothetical protein